MRIFFVLALIIVNHTLATQLEVVAIRHFKLNKGKIHYWEKGSPKIETGSIVIVKAGSTDHLKLSQGHNQMVISSSGRTLEIINTGMKAKYRALVSPVQLSEGEELFLIEPKTLPESFEGNALSVMSFTSSDGPGKKITMQQGNSVLKVHRLKDESALYRQAAQMLLQYAPGARPFVGQYLQE